MTPTSFIRLTGLMLVPCLALELKTASLTAVSVSFESQAITPHLETASFPGRKETEPHVAIIKNEHRLELANGHPFLKVLQERRRQLEELMPPVKLTSLPAEAKTIMVMSITHLTQLGHKCSRWTGYTLKSRHLTEAKEALTRSVELYARLRDIGLFPVPMGNMFEDVVIRNGGVRYLALERLTNESAQVEQAIEEFAGHLLQQLDRSQAHRISRKSSGRSHEKWNAVAKALHDHLRAELVRHGFHFPQGELDFQGKGSLEEAAGVIDAMKYIDYKAQALAALAFQEWALSVSPGDHGRYEDYFREAAGLALEYSNMSYSQAGPDAREAEKQRRIQLLIGIAVTMESAGVGEKVNLLWDRAYGIADNLDDPFSQRLQILKITRQRALADPENAISIWREVSSQSRFTVVKIEAAATAAAAVAAGSGANGNRWEAVRVLLRQIDRQTDQFLDELLGLAIAARLLEQSGRYEDATKTFARSWAWAMGRKPEGQPAPPRALPLGTLRLRLQRAIFDEMIESGRLKEAELAVKESVHDAALQGWLFELAQHYLERDDVQSAEGLSRSIVDPYWESRYKTEQGSWHLKKGDFEQADRLFEEAESKAEELDQRIQQQRIDAWSQLFKHLTGSQQAPRAARVQEKLRKLLCGNMESVYKYRTLVAEALIDQGLPVNMNELPEQDKRRDQLRLHLVRHNLSVSPAGRAAETVPAAPRAQSQHGERLTTQSS